MGMNLDSGELLAVKQVFFLVYFCVLGSSFWFGSVILLLVSGGFWLILVLVLGEGSSGVFSCSVSSGFWFILDLRV